MKLSVIIVNYNVKYFLKQCLSSVFAADLSLPDGTLLDLDVWVVDNDSVDGSVQMVQSQFPQAHLIANTANLGFAKANNLALARLDSQSPAAAASDLLLLLNPDTVVQQDTFARCADFMRSHPDCGALGVKMVDGNGRFLKESKRGFPSPQAAFFKMSGLIRLFPHNRRIAQYYMGHLADDETHEVDVLCGAFLLFRHSVYRQVGGLDESYFMYGEDIDFSWRIRLAGYKNYYLPETRIIHYKGESTKKGSMNYVYTFYNAMSIFVKKYFSGKGARLYTALLHMAIWLRAALAWGRRVAGRLALPAADFAVAYGGFVLLKLLWQQVKGSGGDIYSYPASYTFLVIPVYILILMAASWFAGGYDRPLQPKRVVKGMGAGLLALLAFYSLLDESLRYSRMLLLLGSVWTMASSVAIRLLLRAAHGKETDHGKPLGRSTLVVGSAEECERIGGLYATCGLPGATRHTVAVADTSPGHLQDCIRIHRADEVIFCAHDIELRDIIELMALLRTTGVKYRIAPAEGDFIIGTDTILSPESLYLADLDTISTDTSRRTKRTLDLAVSAAALLFSPVLFWFQRRKKSFFHHCHAVLWGKRTWVGYTGHPGIFHPSDIAPHASPETADRLLLRYMRHYRTATDLAILARNWNNL